MPLLMVVLAPAAYVTPVVAAASLIFLALLGAIGANAGGADVVHATVRVTIWGAIARPRHRYWSPLRDRRITLLARESDFQHHYARALFGCVESCAAWLCDWVDERIAQ